MKQFSVLIKPASSLCNMTCHYCFYNDVASHRSTASYGIMKYEVIDKLLMRIKEHFQEPAHLHFFFQGGEPTLAGLDYFVYFTRQAALMLPKDWNISYSIQTNGFLINEKWCELFKNYDFLVGLSQDGPARLHDSQRTAQDGTGTFARTAYTVTMLRKYNIPFNIVSVITNETAKHPRFYSTIIKNSVFPMCSSSLAFHHWMTDQMPPAISHHAVTLIL